jgi:hypothetical protein
MAGTDTSRGISPKELADILGYIPGSGFQTPWINQTPVVLYNAMPVGIGDFNSTWFDFSNLKRAMIEIVSSLDQAIIVQLVGNGVQDYATARDMGMPQAIAIGGPLPITSVSIDIGVGINDDWHPYLGVIITTLVAPASGLLTITSYSQK